jgi:D-3-phosphoglycerate dehydrogenase
MLTLAKQIIQSNCAIRRASRDWTRWDYKGQELTGRTVGIIGLGNAGRRVAQLCAGMFGMRVIAYDPLIEPENFVERGAESVDLETVMAVADFVSVNCPLTKFSRGMIGAAEFAKMKPSAYFISTARGGIHDEVVLAEVLAKRRIAGAGLDVFIEEPPPAAHPLLDFENVVVSPHNAGVTVDSGLNAAKAAAEQWAVIFAGERPRRLVNPDAWDGFVGRYQALFGAAGG